MTDAGRGLGKAIATELGRRGAMVACVARSTRGRWTVATARCSINEP